MPEQPDPAIMRAWHAFLEAHARITERLGAELEREAGLPLSWYDVLVQLHAVPGARLRMTELAAAVLLSKSGLTRLVDRMCDAGLVSRCADPADRRGTYVQLTEAGARRLHAAAPVHLSGIEQHFGRNVTSAEAATIERALGRALDALAVTDSRDVHHQHA